MAHFNLTNTDSISQITKAVNDAHADLIAVHEVTPDWTNLLEDSLSSFFPHHHTMVDIGIFGMAIYSRHAIESIDTFFYQEIPNLKGCIKKEEELLCFLSIQTEPALNDFSLRRLKEHLSIVGAETQNFDSPTVVLGDFNSVSWSGEIKSFLEQANLTESRKGFMPYPVVSTDAMFQVPLDHIFYSDKLQCTQFENIVTTDSKHLGIIGTYSRKNLTHHVKKTAQ